MIQDIAPHIYHNEYTPVPPSPTSYLIVCHGRHILVREENGEMAFPRFLEAESHVHNLYDSCIYLFSVDKDHFYLAPKGDYSFLSGYAAEPPAYLRSAAPRHLAFAAITAIQLSSWYESRRFCGRCGKPLRHHGKERMMFCDSCHMMEYPKISPAVIVAITDGERLLLTKYAGREIKRYSLIAGFAEIGETIEETIHREVMEEVGLKVKNIRYYKSQPWSFSDTLLFGFYCELDGPDHIKLDEAELAIAEWIDRKDVPGVDNDVSLTQEMMCRFRDGLE
ncbi:NAD(+) diphosphatase [Clostridium sp. AM58-1XD]|uniref:NAD(+) diphosphatase n=1 Tax=Clostridium sp. AM58-1XD TaxID=2292307 RepID=UPI000E543F76|nr:NAD(+) diphosphatase [Clostridium sp. AM58-1XD]RGY99045.1 NAD(+) diphosphatase [Clostridium sp. AM58-1XD]